MRHAYITPDSQSQSLIVLTPSRFIIYFFCDLFSVTVMGLDDSEIFLYIIIKLTIITILYSCCKCCCKICDKSIEESFQEDRGNICIFILRKK